MNIDQLYRSLVLGVAEQGFVKHIVQTRGWNLAKRFVAGEQLEDALEVMHKLEQRGIHTILVRIGEMVKNAKEAIGFRDELIQAIEALQHVPYPHMLSLKLTQLGLDLDDELATEYAKDILQRAQLANAFVCIDMEDSPRLEATLRIFRRLRSEFDNVGTVLQAYLYRSEQDLENLAELKPTLRIVKGAYKESPSVAYSEKRLVDLSYRRLVDAHLKSGNHTAIATHDPRIIEDIKLFVERSGIAKDQFEFQMLYGIREDLQNRLADEGYIVRAYVPYGREWYAYFSRRIAERPANLGFVLRGLLGNALAKPSQR